MNWLQIIRYKDWWVYKITPLLAVAYGTLYLTDQIPDLSIHFLLLLFSIITGAVYVSIINDLTDLKSDKVAEKNNSLAGMSKIQIYILLLLICMVFSVLLFLLNNYSNAAIWYCAAILSYSLYSFPPFRFKERGWIGALADALGANCFPAAFVIAYFSAIANTAVNPIWFISVAFWSLSYGLRGIIWHQYFDKKNDEASGVFTLIRQFSSPQVKFLVKTLFVIELFAVISILNLFHSEILYSFLGLYLLQLFYKKMSYEMEISLALTEHKYFHLLLFEYYEFFMPLGFLAIIIEKNPQAYILLIIHLFLFPHHILMLGKDIWYAFKVMARKLQIRVKKY